MTVVIEPRLLVESDDVDDQRVPFPVTDRVSEVGWIERIALRMRPPVHVDLAPDVRRALEDHDDALLLGQLNDLHRIWCRHQARTTRRQTVPFWVVLRVVSRVVVVDG